MRLATAPVQRSTIWPAEGKQWKETIRRKNKGIMKDQEGGALV